MDKIMTLRNFLYLLESLVPPMSTNSLLVSGTVAKNGGLRMKLTVSLVSLELGWQKWTSMTNCGERNMNSSKIGSV
jgi:hypothetical protein